MSLINDALKKAQSMQARPASGPLKLSSGSGKSHPKPLAPAVEKLAAPASPPSTPARRPAPRPRPGLVLAAAGVLFAATVVVVGFFGFSMWRKASPEIPDSAAAAAPTPMVSAPVAVASTPAADPVVAVSEPAAPVVPVVSVPVVAASDGTAPEVDGASGSRARARSAPSRPRDPRIEAFILGLKVAGIRSGENPKALLNDKVYAVGEFVSAEFDLRLATVHARTLELEDSAGNIYEVRF